MDTCTERGFRLKLEYRNDTYGENAKPGIVVVENIIYVDKHRVGEPAAETEVVQPDGTEGASPSPVIRIRNIEYRGSEEKADKAG